MRSAVWKQLRRGCVDTHLHLVKAGADGGEEYARRLEIALSLRSESEVGFEPARLDVNGQPRVVAKLGGANKVDQGAYELP